jgi:hypothetical protein
MSVKVTNNAASALSANITNSETTIALATGQGDRFPTLGAGDYFYATIIDTAGQLEIVKVTARTGDSLTVVRGQDGTTAKAFSTNDRFELRPTAALFNDKADTEDVTAGLNLKLNADNPSYTGTLTGGTGVINIGSGQLYKDASGNVGIGTSSPGTFGKLEVLGAGYTAINARSSDASGVNIVLAANAADGARLNVLSNHPLQIYTNNTERMRINSAGNVGIGTSSPDSRLHVSGTTTLTTSETATAINSNNATNTGFVLKYAPNLTSLGNNFSQPLVLLTNDTERMRIDNAGNVGIGTSSPVSRLNVAGTTGFTWVGGGTSSGLVTIGTQGTGASLFVNTASLGSDFASGLAVDGTYSGVSSVVNLKAVGVLSGGGYNASLAFHTSSDTILTERMRIDSAGNVGIGTSSPDTKLQVLGSSANDNTGVCFVRNSNTTADACIAAFATGTNSTATSNVLIKFGIDNYNNGQGQINANGANAAAFGSFSDIRLKENIVDLPSQLDNIMALRPVEFDYIESEGGGHQIGFIAQEMQEVYPDAVGERGDGMLTVTGWSKTEARLVKALQEAVAKIAALEARLDAANL